MPHSMMKNNRNIIVCFNNSHQGAPHTGKQMCASIPSSVMVGTLLVVKWQFIFSDK